MGMARGAERKQLFESAEACKRLRDGQVVAVQKFTSVDRDAGETPGKLSFVISDATIDRYGDTIAADGWDFEAFKKNPVLLWAHDYAALPLGIMGAPWKSYGSTIKAEVETFATKDENPMAPAVESMLRRGLLNAVSVGFMPKSFDFGKEGIDYLEQELLEVSVVPVPANANALLEAKGAGLWLPEMDRWVERTLDEKKPGFTLEVARRAFNVLRAPASQVPAGPVERMIEVDELKAAVEENTAAVRGLVAASFELASELRSDRAERRASNAGDRAEGIAAEVAKLLKK